MNPRLALDLRQPLGPVSVRCKGEKRGKSRLLSFAYFIIPLTAFSVAGP